MTAADRKKRHERFLLERFIDASRLPLDIVEERETPDFLVRFDERYIGIEVTQLFVSHDANGPLLQAQEAISSRIVSKARKLYEMAGGPPAHVSAHFYMNRDLRNLNRDNLARRLADVVLQLNLVSGQRSDWRRGAGNGDLAEYIAFVHALGVPTRDMAHWGVPRAGWVAPVTAEALQARIKQKAERLVKYQETVPETWLVIVADGTKPSQLFEVRPDFNAGDILSPFARTFFYAHPERAIVELGV